MKLKYKDKEIHIADDSPQAIAIKAGADYSLDENDKLVVSDPAPNDEPKTRFQFRKAIKKATDIDDLKKILLKLLDYIDGDDNPQ